jgi:hypothetical protein
MSLSHLNNRQQPLTFGGGLNVLIGDTTITGDLIVNGSINGTSSQGQNNNNVWVGTNAYSVYRPTSTLQSLGNTDGINKGFLDSAILEESVVNKASTWSGTNDFSSLGITSTILATTATEAVNGQYIKNTYDTYVANIPALNNVWTNSNTFSYLPTCIEPTNAKGVATKNYTDTNIVGVAQGNSTSIYSQSDIVNTDFGLTCIAVNFQIIGGGGGSTEFNGSCSCSTAGVSGGSASQASIIILTNQVNQSSSNGFITFNNGYGGSAGIGCGTTSGSGSGSSANLYIQPKNGTGMRPTQINILRANSGGGFGGTCGQAGTALGGVYSAINPLVVQPYSASNGGNGVQCAGNIPQPWGIVSYGWGGQSGACVSGKNGNNGGYGAVFFNFP